MRRTDGANVRETFYVSWSPGKRKMFPWETLFTYINGKHWNINCWSRGTNWATSLVSFIRLCDNLYLVTHVFTKGRAKPCFPTFSNDCWSLYQLQGPWSNPLNTQLAPGYRWQSQSRSEWGFNGTLAQRWLCSARKIWTMRWGCCYWYKNLR